MSCCFGPAVKKPWLQILNECWLVHNVPKLCNMKRDFVMFTAASNNEWQNLNLIQC